MKVITKETNSTGNRSKRIKSLFNSKGVQIYKGVEVTN